MKVALLACSLVCCLSLLNQQEVPKKQEAACRGKSLPVTLLDVGGPKLPEPRTFSLLKGGISTRSRLVIRNRERFDDLWEQIVGPKENKPAPPEVDFSREMLVVAAMGERPSSGYEIVITGACEVDNQVEVHVRSSNYTQCGGTQMGVITAPVDIVRMPKSDLPVVFRETEYPSTPADCKELFKPK
jgi:hypothetical protein